MVGKKAGSKKKVKTAKKKTAKVKKVKSVKKKTVKKPAKVRTAKTAVKPAKPVVNKAKAGDVTHYYSDISVAVVKVSSPLKVGDQISIEGATTNFRQKVDSMQINHNSIAEAKAGDEIGMKLKGKAREGDTVYKI